MSSQQLRFDNRVVLVTGAGNGLGREYALAFASRGAKVVVNDLGGDSKGEGKSAQSADIVVEEIRSKGGIAVANYDSVEEGEKIVKAVLDSFGRIDIIINNAGILRDRSFARTSDMDWDIIHRIHLRSVFLITRAAWPHMKNQNYGRVILVSSAAGIYGNFGQSNYSSAKMGVVGLANTLAIEGTKNNIGVNVIAPIAASRMTQSVMPEQLFKSLKPEYIAPLVLWLCHEDCSETGGLFECGAGWIAKLRWERSSGAMVRRQEVDMSPEGVRDNWEKITDFTNGEYPSSIQEGNMAYIAALQKFEENQHVKLNKTSASASSSLVEAVGMQSSGVAHTYTERDVILYALGVGVSTQQEDGLKFLYEGHSDFSVLPSFIVIPAFFAISNIALPIDPTMILHGEQYCELYRPLAPSDILTSKAVVADVVDKGSGAVVIYDIETHNEAGVHVATSQIVVFVKKAGGFGGRRSSEKLRSTADPPKRAPCASIVEKTGVDQAAIYRLSGDRNPLHIDPSFAALGGFPTPILHGLCSFGYAIRHVLKQFCNNDVTKFKAVKARFSSPVLPGQTLQTDMWKDGCRIFLQCKVVETGKACLTGAYVDLFDKCASSPAAGQVSSTKEPILKSDAIFNAIAEQLKRSSDLTDVIDASYLFVIRQNGVATAEWYVNLRKGTSGSLSRGKPGQGVKADCTLTMTDDDLVDLATGKLNGMQAFTSGRLSVSGNLSLTFKLEKVFNSTVSKL